MTSRTRLAQMVAVVATCALLGACGSAAATSSSPSAGSAPSAGTTPSASSAATAGSSSGGDSSVDNSTSADTKYYVDLDTADPALSTYVNQQSQVALRALLADGIDFCDVLYQGGGIDNAMTSVAAGADRVESTTHLPRSVTTFNAIDSAALLALCPSAQHLLPASDQKSLKQLAKAVAASQAPTASAG
jgi:hypothetical protein